MKKRIIALSSAMLIILGAVTAYADALLYTPVLSAPVGGQLQCHVTNVGKKALTEIYIAMIGGGVSNGHACSDVPSQSGLAPGATCANAMADSASCAIRITGGSYRSVRAVLNVVDSSGATILSVPATK